jgi:hypothetical protein
MKGWDDGFARRRAEGRSVGSTVEGRNGEAERRIDDVARAHGSVLNLGGLGLTAVPGSIGRSPRLATRAGCGASWGPRHDSNDRDQAAKNATPAAVNQIFAEIFSPGDGWSFERSEGAARTIYSIWKRSNGHLPKIGVVDAVEAPYYVADQAQFT